MEKQDRPEKEMKPQTIIRLQGENILRLKAFKCDPAGAPIVLVEGQNEVGKTTVLRCIEMALCGGKAIPEEPITKGKLKGQILLQTEDFLVRRTFTKKTTTLVVEAHGEKVPKKPQELLDRLTGALSFDPLKFVTAKTADQVDMLKEALKLDFTELDDEYTNTYEARRVLNRALADLIVEEGHAVTFPDSPKDEDGLVSVAKLMKELEDRRQTNALNNIERDNLRKNGGIESDVRSEIETATDEIVAVEETITQRSTYVKKQIEELRKAAEEFYETQQQALTEKREHRETREAYLKEIAEEGEILAKMVPKLRDVDETEIVEKISGAEETNTKIRANIKAGQRSAQIGGLQDDVAEKTAKLQEIGETKCEMIAGADLKIPGLSFDEDGVRHDGIPFKQLSRAQQIRISTAVGLSINPLMKVMLIRDGSLLDEKNLKLMLGLAVEAGAQIWIEKVTEDEEVKVLIVEGDENEG